MGRAGWKWDAKRWPRRDPEAPPVWWRRVSYSMLSCIKNIKTKTMNFCSLPLIKYDKIIWFQKEYWAWFLSDTCFASWLQFLAGNLKRMCAAKKTDGLVAGGLLDSRRWFEWGVDTYESPAAGIWQTLRDTERKNRGVPTGWEFLQKAASFCLAVPQKKLQHIGHCY